MSRLFSSPGVLGRERPPEPVVVKENSETREDGAGPSAENVVWLPDAIETIESVPDATETIESVPDATVDSCCDESEMVVKNIETTEVVNTIKHVQKLLSELDNQTKEEHVEKLPSQLDNEKEEKPSDSSPPLFVQMPGWKLPVPLDSGYSLVDFAGRHHTRAAVQRRYQVRKRADPVRHAKHKLYYRNYMKIYQQKLKLKKTKQRIATAIARMELKQLAKKAADLTQLDCPKDTPSDPPIDAPGDPTMDTSCDPPIESMPLAFAAALNLSPSKVPSAQAAETVTQQSPDFTEVMVPQKKQKKRKRSNYLMILPSQKAKKKRQCKSKPKAEKSKAAKSIKASGIAENAEETAHASVASEELSEAQKEKAAKRAMRRLVQSVSSNVECPFDRVAEPQRTIDWYKERVGHLEESLEQAIYLNLKDFRPRSPPPQKPVKMSTAEFFGEDGQKESSDTDGSVDISDMPVVAERVRSGSESSTWADYDSDGCLSDGNSDINAGRTDMSDVYAIEEFDRQDFRNLGQGYLGNEFLKKKKSKSCRSYANTLAKAQSCFEFSTARFVKFPDDKE